MSAIKIKDPHDQHEVIFLDTGVKVDRSNSKTIKVFTPVKQEPSYVISYEEEKDCQEAWNEFQKFVVKEPKKESPAKDVHPAKPVEVEAEEPNKAPVKKAK